MIGDAIRRARTERGLTQESLAQAAGISRNYLVQLEKGANITVDVLQKIMEALDLDSVALDHHRRVKAGSSDTPRANSALLLQRVRELHAALRVSMTACDDIGKLVEPPGRGGMAAQLEAVKSETPQELREFGVADVVDDLTALPDSPFRKPSPFPVTDDWIEVQIEGRVAAGPRSPIDDDYRDTRLVPRESAPDPKWKVVEAYGDSMIDYDIESGDLVYIEEKLGGVAATGDLVIGWLNEGLVVKRWERRQGRKWLVSGNPEIEPLEITPNDVWELRAIVRGTVPRKPRLKRFTNISSSPGKGGRA